MVEEGGIMGGPGGGGAGDPGGGDGGGAGDPGGGGPGDPGGGGGPGAGGPSPKWVGGLSSDFGGTAILSQIPDSDQSVSVPVTLVKNYVEGQKALGGMTTVPKDGDDPAKFEKFYQSIGRPEKPDGYELKAPEGTPEGFYNPEELTEFQAKAHSLGIPKKSAEALFAWRAEKDLAVYNEFTGNAAKGYEENIKVLKGAWGASFTGNVELANKAAAWAGGKELEQLIQQAGLAGHPVIAKAFHKIGSILGEDSLKGINLGDGFQAGPKYTEVELKEMMKQPRYQNDAAFQDEVRKGFEALYPGAGGADLNPSRPRTR